MRIRLLAAVLVFLALLGGLQLYLMRGGLSGQAREALEGAFLRLTGEELAVDQVRLTLIPPRMIAEDVEVPDLDGPLAGAVIEEVRVRVSPWSVVTGGIRAFDVTLIHPQVVLVAEPSGDAGGTAVLPPIPILQPGAHRLTVRDGRLVIRYGERRVEVDGVEISAEPDVTLSHGDVAIQTAIVKLDNEPLLDASRAEMVLTTDQVRLRNTVVESVAGRLSMSGEVRSETAEDGTRNTELGLSTRFEGTVEDALALARRLGAEVPEGVSGGVAVSGRLYGAPRTPSWDGTVTLDDLALVGEPRTVPEATVRLRAGADRVEVVHLKAVAGGGELRGSGDLFLGDGLRYEGRLRADDVALAWLANQDDLPGELSGEAHLSGVGRKRPYGQVEWRYRNSAVRREPFDTSDMPLWRRMVEQLERGNGVARLSTDGAHDHTLSISTGDSKVAGRVTVGADGGLFGKFTATSGDFADVGHMIGLPYVHGKAQADIDVTGTVSHYLASARAVLEDGHIRDLRVGRLTGQVALSPGRLVFHDVQSDGPDGAIRMAGEVTLPSKEHPRDTLAIHLAADLSEVPLTPLAGLFYTNDVLELDVPVSGRVQVVKEPDVFYAWSRVATGAGRLYGQEIASGGLGMWIDKTRMVLTDMRFDLPGDGVHPVTRGIGTLWWEDGHYRASLESTAVPLTSVNILSETVPFLGGVFAGQLAIKGDFEDPHLHVAGAIRDGRFYGEGVGDGDLEMNLSRWQLRVRADVKPPSSSAAEPSRVVYYMKLDEEGPFSLSARLNDMDGVPWTRGLLPEVDELFREEMGDDYGLTGSGRLAASGTVSGGTERLRLSLAAARVTTGAHQAELLEPVRLSLRDGVLTTGPVVLQGAGLSMKVTGSLVPEERFDLGVEGVADAAWIDHLRPDWGIIGGRSRFNVAVTGPWDTTTVAGTVHPETLQVAPPEVAFLDMIFTMSGDVAVSGPLEDPPLGQVRASFPEFSVRVLGSRMDAPGAAFTGKSGHYTFPTLELAGPSGSLQVEGDWDYDRSVHLKAAGSMNISEVALQVDGLSRGSGEAQVHGSLEGDWNDPWVSAGMTLSGGQVRIGLLDQLLEINNASAVYEKGRLVVDTMEGRMGGAPVSAEGAWDVYSGEVSAIVVVEHHPFRAFTDLSGMVSGELALSGTLPAARLSGDLRVERALFDKRMQWGGWDTEATGFGLSGDDSGLGQLQLAIRLVGDEDILLDNNLAKLEAELDLLATGTLAAPSLVGRVDIRQGEIRYREHVFEVEHATVDFLRPDRIDPYLDVLAHTVVQHALPDDPLRTEPIEVDMSLTGPVDQLDLVLTSRPDLPQQDLISLLAVGRTAEEMAEAGGGLGATEATYFATGALQTELEEQVHRFTGLDRFHVDPFYGEGDSTASSARVTVGKKLFKGRGQVTYSTVMDATQEPIIQMNYRISPKLSVLAEQDEEGGKGGEMRLRIRFR
ncbi:MAG: translocation/assembly module TamB domain-containing protein [Leptospirillia bacterium]